MSSSTTSDSLSKAYRLIEADELAAARAVLEPLVAAEPDNADAWWLYSHAVTDTFVARHALDEVLRINPNYPGARELMAQLEIVTRSEQETEPLPDDTLETVEYEPEPVVDEAPVADEDLFDEDAFDEEPDIAPVTDEAELREAVEEGQRRSWVPVAALVAIVAVVLVAALLLLQGQGTDEPDDVVAVPSPSQEIGVGIIETEAVDTPEEVIAPTEEDAATEAPVATEVEETDVEPTSEEPVVAPTQEEVEDVVETEVIGPVDTATEPVDAEASVVVGTPVAMLPPGPDFTPLVDALADFSVQAADVSEVETDLGDTVVVTVCATAGTSLRQNLPAVMDVIASRAAVVAADAEAIGARMVNCATERPLAFIAVPKEQAVDYAVGNLTAEEFQATWRPQ